MALTGLHHARAVNFKAKAFKPIATHNTTRPVAMPALRSSAAARVLGGLASHAPGALIALTCQPVGRRHLCIPRAAETTIEGSPEPDVPPGLNLAKVASLGSLFFASTFCYTILQNLKDSIVVTSIGAEALPFLEAYGVLPLSLAFYVLYNKLNQRLPEKWVYQAALLPFLSYYALFGAVLWPLADKIHPTHLLEGLKAALPAGLVGLAGMVVNWSFSLFFIMGELWGGVAISLLFWGLADEVCTMREAESVYPLLGILANIGLVLSGAWIKTVNGWGSHLAQFGLQPVQALIATVLIVSMGLFAVKAFIHDTYVKPESPASPVRRRKGDKKKKSGKSITESLSVLKNSPKVNNLAILVISYFISQKLFDFAWKAQLRVMYPSPAAYQQILADVAQYTGMATIALMCTSKFVFRWGGWRAAALATPVTVLISGAVFFASAIAMQGGANVFGPEVVGVLMAVGGVAGVVGRVASRAPKYSLFDPAKEMVYITMNKQEKLEGKAAVDLLGSYFGKSGASWIMQILVLTLGSLTKAMPIMALVHMVVGVAWTRSTFSLATLMEKSQAEEERKEREAAAAAATAAEPPAANETGNGGSHLTSNGNGTDGNEFPSPAYVGISNSNGYTNASGNTNGHAYSTNGNSNGNHPAVPFTTGPINANGSMPTTFKLPA